MKLPSWNCQGLGNLQTVQTLAFIIKEKGADLVFLIETKLSGTKANRIASKLKYNCCIVVDVVGRIGGLILLWKQNVDFELFNYSNQHIN